MNISQDTVKLSSSLLMENLETQEKIMNLGKQLIDSLNLPESDEITEWMVNYIAEQIINAENSNKDTQLTAKKHCFETILTLWEYRAFLPNGTRPFEKFEEVFRALAALDPENPYPIYYSTPEQNSPNLSTEAKKWVEFGKNIDYVAKILVLFSFQQAISTETDKSSLDWLNTIKDSVKCEEARIIVKIFGSDIDDDKKQDEKLKNDKIEKLSKRLEQLKAFEDISMKQRGLIEQQLQTLIKKN